jgi:hypothetical protein
MNRRPRTCRVALVASSVLLVITTARPLPVQATNDAPQSLDSHAGLTVGQWSARWWQWAAAFPDVISPVSDPSGARCWLGRLGGPVFFLAGTAGGSVERSCTVPTNKALLIPAVNAECSFVPDDCGTGRDYQTLLHDVHNLFSGPQGVVATVTVDGVTLDAKEAISPPPPFTIVWTPHNPFDIPPAIGPAVADGFWVLLAPLTPGTHTILIAGSVPDLGFSVTARYDLTVRA